MHLAERQVRPGFQIVLDAGVQDAAQPALVADDDVIEAFARVDPIKRSAYAFCHSELTAVTTAKEANAELSLTHSRQSVILRAKPAT
jgi:hypothetical protein